MPTVCPSYLKGRRLRVTRLDQAGRPVYGPCGQVVTAGFVSVELGSETEEGEDITQLNAAGEICVSEPAEPQLRYRTVNVTLCQVDPDLVTMMTGWTKEVDDAGNTVGWRGNTEMGGQASYAVELWMDTATTQSSDVCAPGSDPNQQGQWGYLLLPRVRRATWGDVTIENAAVNFSFTGRAVTGSRWGRGPYNVIIHNGRPSPLATPIAPTEDHLLRVVGVRPPQPQCGCQPVQRPTPPEATLLISGVPGEVGDERHTVRLTVDNHGFGPVTVSWGETGGTPQTVAECRTVEHTYAEPGTYTITVRDQQTPSAYTATREITIPLPPDEPALSAEASRDDPTQETSAVTATWDNHGNGPVNVDFGDGSDEAIRPDQPDSGSFTYTYQQPGVYTIQVTDVNQPTHTSRVTVTVPVHAAPTLSLASEGLTTTATVDNHGNGNTTVTWGDNTDPTTGPDQGDVTHTYTAAGTYTVTVASNANPLASATGEITVEEAQPPTVSTAPTAGEPLSVDLTVNNHGNGPVDVAWGDGNTGQGPNSGTVAHVYAAADAGPVTITATDPDTGASAGADAHPQPPPEATAATTGTANQVELTVTNHGHGATTVDWGDGSATEPGPGSDGGTVTHTYADGSTYTITVTSDANAEATTSATFPPPAAGRRR